MKWTSHQIEETYDSYIDGYKLIDGIRNPISAFTISADNTPIGYIQLYNAHDFPREGGIELEGLLTSLAIIDYFISEPDYIGNVSY